MTRYPRQVDREYLSCRSGGLNKIQMIDGGTLDLHQDLVVCDRRRRYIVEHQLPTIFQQSDSFHTSSPHCPFGRAWWRAQSGSFVSARPNSRSRPAMSALEPTRSNHSSINAVSLLYCRTCSIGVCANVIGRPSASVKISAASAIVRMSPARSISRRFKAAASVNARAPYHPMSSTAIICSFVPCPSAQASVEPWRLKGAIRFSMKNTGRRITCEGKRRPRTVSSIRHLLSKCGTPVCLFAEPTEV